MKKKRIAQPIWLRGLRRLSEFPAWRRNRLRRSVVSRLKMMMSSEKKMMKRRRSRHALPGAAQGAAGLTQQIENAAPRGAHCPLDCAGSTKDASDTTSAR